MSIVRFTPRISINQLASYLVSTPSQRRRIIQNQKRPPTFLVNWYESSSNCISKFILEGCSNEDILLSEIERLYSILPTTEYEETRYRTNAEALEAFFDAYDRLDFFGLDVVEGFQDPPKLLIAGIEISVRPEFVVKGQYRQQEVVGALKLYFSKHDPLNEISAPYITAVVMQYAQNQLASPTAKPRAQQCQVLDIFAGAVYSAPSAVKRRFQDIEAACQEIALLWPVV